MQHSLLLYRNRSYLSSFTKSSDHIHLVQPCRIQSTPPPNQVMLPATSYGVSALQYSANLDDKEMFKTEDIATQTDPNSLSVCTTFRCEKERKEKKLYLISI